MAESGRPNKPKPKPRKKAPPDGSGLTYAYCELCDVRVPRGIKSWGMHVLGLKHLKATLATGGGDEPPPAYDPESRYCEICHMNFNSPAAFAHHAQGYKHKARVLRQKLTNGQGAAQAFADREGLHIVMDEVPATITQGSTHTVLLHLSNMGRTNHYLCGCSQLPPLPEVSITCTDPLQPPPPPILLEPGAGFTIYLCIAPRDLGFLQTTLVLNFGDACTILKTLSTKCDVPQVQLVRADPKPQTLSHSCLVGRTYTIKFKCICLLLAGATTRLSIYS